MSATALAAATYTLQSVTTAVPAPTPDELDLFRVTISSAELVKAGAQISTSRILTDSVRWAGQALTFCAQAPPGKLINIGYSTAQLHVFVHEIAELDKRYRQRAGSAESVRDARDIDQANALLKETEGKAERESIHALLANAALDDQAAHAELATAYGTAPDGTALAVSLRQLGERGKQWLQAGEGSRFKPGLRLKVVGVTAARFDQAIALAEQVDATAARAKGAGVAEPVTQAQLDEQDGRVLAHMRTLRNLFETARQTDGTVPQLIPIATHNLFVRDAPAPKPTPAPTPVDA